MKLFSKEDLQVLKENKEILYIYRLPCSLFDCGFEYIIVGNLSSMERYDNVRYFKLDE